MQPPTTLQAARQQPLSAHLKPGVPLQRLPVQHGPPSSCAAIAQAQRRRRGHGAARAAGTGAARSADEELAGTVQQQAVHQPRLQLLEQHLAAVPQQALRTRLQRGHARVCAQRQLVHDASAHHAAPLHLAHQRRCLGQQHLPLQQELLHRQQRRRRGGVRQVRLDRQHRGAVHVQQLRHAVGQRQAVEAAGRGCRRTFGRRCCRRLHKRL